MAYRTRSLDEELDALSDLPAIVLQGAKEAGQAPTCLRRVDAAWRAHFARLA